MSLGLTSRKEQIKRRNKRVLFSFKFIFFIASISATFYYAFKMGGKIASDDAATWKNLYNEEKENNQNLRIKLGSNKADVEQLTKLLPNQKTRDLLKIIHKRNADGIAVMRMTNLISGMSKTEKCTTKTEFKRMMVSTPISPKTRKVSFAKGLINIDAKGSPDLNKNGKLEEWFDVNKEINLNFTLPGGETQAISSKLPIYYSITLRDYQYKFSIISGRKSYADISMIKCDL